MKFNILSKLNNKTPLLLTRILFVLYAVILFSLSAVSLYFFSESLLYFNKVILSTSVFLDNFLLLLLDTLLLVIIASTLSYIMGFILSYNYNFLLPNNKCSFFIETVNFSFALPSIVVAHIISLILIVLAKYNIIHIYIGFVFIILLFIIILSPFAFFLFNGLFKKISGKKLLLTFSLGGTNLDFLKYLIKSNKKNFLVIYSFMLIYAFVDAVIFIVVGKTFDLINTNTVNYLYYTFPFSIFNRITEHKDVFPKVDLYTISLILLYSVIPSIMSLFLLLTFKKTSEKYEKR